MYGHPTSPPPTTYTSKFSSLHLNTGAEGGPKRKTHNYVGTALGGFPTSCFCKRGPTGCLNLLPTLDIWTLDAVSRTRICVNAVYQGGPRWRGRDIDDVSFLLLCPGRRAGTRLVLTCRDFFPFIFSCFLFRSHSRSGGCLDGFWRLGFLRRWRVRERTQRNAQPPSSVL